MQQQKEEKLIKEFNKRKIRQYIVMVPSIILITALFLSKDVFDILSQYIPGGYIKYLPLVVVVPMILFTYYNWRCPSCKQHFGKEWFPTYCKHCGAKFTK